MSCTKCNCKTAPCGCEDQGLTTPPPCSVDTAFCPKPSPCSEQFDSQCIVYNGEGNVCADITTGQNLQDVIDTLGNISVILEQQIPNDKEEAKIEEPMVPLDVGDLDLLLYENPEI